MSTEPFKPLCQVFFHLVLGEKKAEIIRELLCQRSCFEPYTIFRYLSPKSPRISPCDIKNFLIKNHVLFEEEEILKTFIRQYDRDGDGGLSFEEWLGVVLVRDQPGLRSIVAQRQPYIIEEGEMEEEMEYTLTKLFEAEISCYLTLESMLPSITLSVSQIFSMIDKDCSGFIDFENLLYFFKNFGFFPYEEEIIYILRRVDRNDDGRIDKIDLAHVFLEENNKNKDYESIIMDDNNRKSQFDYYSNTYNNNDNKKINPYEEHLNNNNKINKNCKTFTNNHFEEYEYDYDNPLDKEPKEKIKNFRYYPYKPIRKGLSSPLKNDDKDNNKVFSSIISRNLLNSKNVEDLIKTERYSNPSLNENNNRTTLRDLRQKYKENIENSPYSFRRDLTNKENEQKNYNLTKVNTYRAKYSENNDDFIVNENIEGKNVGYYENSPPLLKELADFFNFVINSERKLEIYKKELSLRPDFNLVDLFMFFDREKKGFCSKENLLLLLKELALNPKEKETSLFFKRFARTKEEKKGFLKFPDFSDAFCPVTKENFQLLNQRKPINIDEKFRLKELFSFETLRILANLIGFHLQNEKEQEKIRGLLFKKEEIGLLETAFRFVNKSKDGLLKKEEIKDFLKGQGLDFDIDEVELLMERFDGDRDKKISLEEFREQMIVD